MSHKFPYTPPAQFPYDCLAHISGHVMSKTLAENWQSCWEAASWLQVFVAHSLEAEDVNVIGATGPSVAARLVSDSDAIAAAEAVQASAPQQVDGHTVANLDPSLKKYAITLALYVLQKLAERYLAS